MSLFNFFKGNNIKIKEETISQKSQQEVIDMSKKTDTLNKVVIDMSKNSKVDMAKHMFKAALVMDYSISMGNLFQNGSIQDTITRLLPIPLKFDDNGEMESWLFSDGKVKLEPINIHNYKTYVKDIMMKSSMNMGGTNYAPVLKDIINYYKPKSFEKDPVLVIFITDGDAWDVKETTEIIHEISEYNIFIQFIGIGNTQFAYLKALDNLKGRRYDNTGFISVLDISEMTDEELYIEILRQYKEWLNNR